jgi:hypothetical protein
MRVAPPDPFMVSSATTHSTHLPQSSTQPPWILDSGVSFHMTHDSTYLDSLSSLHSPVSVKTADDTPLPIVGVSTLYTSSFHVPYVSHVPQPHLQFFSTDQIIDHGCRVILDSDFCSIQDRRTGTLVLSVGSVILLVLGSLTGSTFLQLLLCASRLPLLMLLLLSPLPPPALLSGIIV